MPCGRVTNTTWRLTFTVASLVAMVMVKAAAAHRVLCRCHLLAEMFELQHGCERNKNHVLAGSMTIAAQVRTRSAPSEMALDGVTARIRRSRAAVSSSVTGMASDETGTVDSVAHARAHGTWPAPSALREILRPVA